MGSESDLLDLFKPFRNSKFLMCLGFGLESSQITFSSLEQKPQGPGF